LYYIYLPGRVEREREPQRIMETFFPPPSPLLFSLARQQDEAEEEEEEEGKDFSFQLIHGGKDNFDD
jgi:hypothetical protein